MSTRETKRTGRPPLKSITPERNKYSQGESEIAESISIPEDGRNLRARNNQKFNYKNPCMILTAGPTGSGKSDLTQIALELLYSTQGLPKCKKFLVDDLVEKSDLYKKKIDDIIEKFGCDKSISEGDCNLINPSPTILKHFEEAYMSTRKVGPCNSLNPEPCNDIFKSSIKAAISDGKNISIETTGSKIPLDYVNLVDLSKYNIVFVYSLVSFDALLGRNTNRASKNMTTYLNDKTKPGPRLPDVSEKEFKKNTSLIIQTIIKLRNVCLRRGRPPYNICQNIASGSPFTLLIYDNDGLAKKLVYNSRTSNDFMTDAEFVTFISRYKLDLPNKTKLSKKTKSPKKSSGGKKTLKRKYRKNK